MSAPKNKPIKVTDPNDPRLKAYQDSLKLYNYGEENKRILLDPNTTPDSWRKQVEKNDNSKNRKDIIEIFQRLNDLNGIPVSGKNNIRNWKSYLGLVNTEGSAKTYTKPVQPYEYQPNEGEQFIEGNAVLGSGRDFRHQPGGVFYSPDPTPQPSKRTNPKIPLMSKRSLSNVNIQAEPIKTKELSYRKDDPSRFFMDTRGEWNDSPQMPPKTDGTEWTEKEMQQRGYRKAGVKPAKATINNYKKGGTVKKQFQGNYLDAMGYGLPMFNFGGILKDTGLALGDTVTSVVNKDIIPDSAYSTGVGRDISNVTGGITNAAAPAAAGLLVPGGGALAMQAIQMGSNQFIRPSGKQSDTGRIMNSLDPFLRMGAAAGASAYSSANSSSSSSVPKKKYGGETLYNQKRANELGYKPDETGHLPSVDYTNGMWLKSKKHPTAFKELQAYLLSAELQRELKHPVVNPEGFFGKDQLQYIPKKEEGGPAEKTLINVEGGELEVDPSGKVIKKFMNKPKHPAFGIDKDGNTMSTIGNVIIPKNMTAQFLKRKNDSVFKRTVLSNLKYRQSLREKEVMAKHGGKVKMYDEGGGIPFAPLVGPRENFGNQDYGTTMDGIRTLDSPQVPMNFIYPQPEYNGNQYFPQFASSKLPMNTPDASTASTNTPSDWQQLSGNQKAGYIAGQVGTYLPALYNIGRSIFDKSDQMNANDYTVDANLKFPELKGEAGRLDMRNAFNASRRSIRNMGSGSPQLQGQIALANRMFESLGKFNEDLENRNKSGRFEASRFNKTIEQSNARTRFDVNMFNKQSKANKRNFGSKGVEQVSQILQNNSNNNLMMNYLKSSYPGYNINKYTGQGSYTNTGNNNPIFGGSYNSTASTTVPTTTSGTPPTTAFTTMWLNNLNKFGNLSKG